MWQLERKIKMEDLGNCNKLDNEEKLKNSNILALVGCVFIVTLPFQYMLNGYVILKMWEWFIVPFGIQEITIAWACGISTFIGFFMPYSQVRNAKEQKFIKKNWTESDVAIQAFVKIVFVPLFTLLMGYIFHWFML